jgi:hypothetical protein
VGDVISSAISKHALSPPLKALCCDRPGWSSSLKNVFVSLDRVRSAKFPLPLDPVANYKLQIVAKNGDCTVPADVGQVALTRKQSLEFLLSDLIGLNAGVEFGCLRGEHVHSGKRSPGGGQVFDAAFDTLPEFNPENFQILGNNFPRNFALGFSEFGFKARDFTNQSCKRGFEPFCHAARQA